LNQKTLFDNNE